MHGSLLKSANARYSIRKNDMGHESILTTERYLGSEQDLKNAVNDALVFE